MNRTFALSDIHGCWGLWKKVKNFIDETDHIYFLGDAADRQLHGMKIIADMLADKRVTYLLGNHEDIFVQVGTRLIADDFDDTCLWLWHSNGGYQTSMDFMSLSDKDKTFYLNKLHNLPRSAEYVNKNGQTIFMCHAGTNPGITERDWACIGEKNAYIWNRRHFCDKWSEDEQYKNYFIVHGHTPIHFLLPELGLPGETDKNFVANIVRYADGHKIDIDLASFYSKRTALLDLDTLEPIYFEEEQDA